MKTISEGSSMRPLLPLLVTVTLTAGLAVSASPATAAATCQGRPATIEASGVPRVDGTEGDDVIVTDNVNVVHALGGDDLICVAGSTGAYVDAGAGNDVVDASGITAVSTYTVLGEGDDTYLGSAAIDTVHAGTVDGSDAGRDVIDTGPRGADFDHVTSGQPSAANPDRVTGDWMTLVWAGTPTAGSLAKGGKDSLFATEDRSPRRVTLDTRAGTYAADGSPVLELRGFTKFNLDAHRELERLSFRGSNRDETLFVSNAKKPVVRIAMGGGDDTVTIGTYARGSGISGGDGRDYLDVLAAAHLDLDLRRETLTRGTGRKAVTYEVNGFEDAFVRADTARLIGTDGPNKLATDACSTRIEGLGGRDTLRAFNNTGYDRAGDKCTGQGRVTARVLGGPGNDTLKGSKAKDLLVGGTGRDKADGRTSRDTCRAEKRISCEVVRR